MIFTMKKPALSCLLLLLSLCLYSFKLNAPPRPQIVDWDTHYLGAPDQNSAYAALTTTTWHYDYRAKINGDRLHIDFNFVAGIDPERSWVKYNRIRDRQVSRQLLNHEQGHVYINYIQLRDGEIRMQDQAYTPRNYKRLIQQTANQISGYYSNLQERYDLETKHGSDLAAQGKWDSYLQRMMDRYD